MYVFFEIHSIGSCDHLAYLVRASVDLAPIRKVRKLVAEFEPKRIGQNIRRMKIQV